MVSDVSGDDCHVNEENDVSEDVIDDGLQPNKNKRGKIPKKILKSEREKLKREQLNEYFSKLGSLVELSDQNNGKASILNVTIRLLKEMISQIQSLRKENLTLLSEFQYVEAEKNELKDENSALEVQIKRMLVELEEKLTISKPQLNSNHLPGLPSMNPLAQQSSMMGPLYVIPINPDFQAYQRSNIAESPPVSVSKPHPRYPTPADSWPLHLLSKQPETTTESTVS